MKSIFVFGLATLVLAAAASASPLTLIDKNSTVTIDTVPADPNDPNYVGMTSWEVNGTNHLYQQWFWVGVGGYEESIDKLSLASEATFDDDFNTGDEVAEISYVGAGFTVDLAITLTGSDGKSSSIGEVIEITNTSTTDPLDLRFYQYNDFDLNGGSTDDLVVIADPPGNTAIQTDDFTVTESAAVQIPDHFEVGSYPDTVVSLNDGAITTLSDTTGPLGPEDLTWAFQWNFTIGAGDSVLISKNKTLDIPAPAALPMISLSGMAMLLRRRR